MGGSGVINITIYDLPFAYKSIIIKKQYLERLSCRRGLYNKTFLDLPFDAIAGTLCYVYNMGHKYTKGKLCNTTVLYT